ncbi:AGAP006739-PA [Anopheles gambiae str. PEST]|uniref:AGAP006739-PA n=1 Tax=Anopheles gambiae TaxID=7165 RepID=Q5TWF4_ANOGA|nr:AGAP006739-PA [Anopheles gambiae str. PEST]
MRSLWLFLLVAAPLVLAEDKLKKPNPAVAPAVASTSKIADSVASPSVTEYKKTLIRKPKRSNGEIPLLIIRPVDKRRKIYFKEPTVKIASGGVATYGTYPELHTNDGEMFTLEHMLPILSLEGMLKGFSKHGPNHFVPSPQFKPSDIHHLVAPQKTKEEYHHQLAPLKPSQLLSISHKPAEAVPAQTLPSPPPPNYVPAVNSEDQLLKLGQPQPSFSPLVQDKPAFVKPEQLPASFNFKVQEEVGHYKVNAIPLSKPPAASEPQHHHQHHHPAHQQHHHYGQPTAGGATSYVGSQQGKSPQPPQSQPLYIHAAPPATDHHASSSGSKWQEVVPKKSPQVSVSTNFYHPKTIVTEQEQSQHTKAYAQAQQAVAAPPSQQQPTVQTHLSYYFPKEESAPQSAPVAHHQHGQQSATSYSNVQASGSAPTGDHPLADTPAEKPIHKTYSSHIKQKYQKQHHQQPHVFIQKYFEFPSKPGTHQKNVVSEFHGSQGNDTSDHQHLPEPQAYAAPQYLPLPQPQALHQPQHTVNGGPGAQTLHLQLHHPVHHPVHHPMHHGGPAQSYWKFGRRNQDTAQAVKPVVEHTNEPDHHDSQHAGSVLRPVKHTTVTIGTSTESAPSASKDSKDGQPQAQDRIDQGAQTTNSTASASTSAPTRTPKQIQHGCERRCIRNTVAQAYEPVCGTDGVTYSNRGKLRCARTCGNDDLEIRSYGECSTTSRNA